MSSQDGSAPHPDAPPPDALPAAPYTPHPPPPPRLRGVLSLNDLEPAARRHLPRPLFAYIAGAAEDNVSLRGNRESFQHHRLQTQVLKDVSRRSQAVTVFGQRFASPFGIAPVGIAAICAFEGDLVLARAAQAAAIPAIMSGTSLIRMEEVHAAAPGTWFQAYLPGDAGRIAALIDRVQAAGFTTLVVTVDIPVWANRENNVRAGFSLPLRPSLRLAWDGLVRPRWLFGTLARTVVQRGMPHFENSFAQRGAPLFSASALRDTTGRDHLNWRHLEAIRQRWPGHLVVKGILNPADAERAVAVGADGVIVSNHGGRQLDGAVAPLTVLPAIVDRVGHRATVMMDGGVRRGTDVLKAVALGARLVFLGRPFICAAAVAGQQGVDHAIRLLRDEVDRDMAMMGTVALADVTAATLVAARS